MRRGFRLTVAIAPLLLAAAGGGGATTAAAPDGPPLAARRPVTDRYVDVEIVDDYRWLEDSSDPAVRAWGDAENSWARSILDRLPQVADGIGSSLDHKTAEAVDVYAFLFARLGVAYRPPPARP